MYIFLQNLQQQKNSIVRVKNAHARMTVNTSFVLTRILILPCAIQYD